MKHLFVYPAVMFLSVLNTFGQGRIVWDESVNGLLSRTYTSPTSFGFLTIGTNSVLGSVEATPQGGGWGGNNDYFTFQVPSGMRIEGAYLLVNQQILAWLGTANFANEIGYRFTSTSQDLLPFLNPTWTEGTYGMYMSNNDLQSVPTIVNYRLDFVMSPVPEPSTWALLGLGSALFWCAARRRRK